MSVVRIKSNASAYSVDLTTTAHVAPKVTGGGDSSRGSHLNVNLDCRPVVGGTEAIALKMPPEAAIRMADAIIAEAGEHLVRVVREGCPVCHLHHGAYVPVNVDLDALPVVTYLNNRATQVIPQATKPADPGEIATLWSVKFRRADSDTEPGPYHFTGQRYSAYTDPIVKRLFYAGDMTTLSSYAFGRQIHQWLGQGYLAISDSERYAEVAALTETPNGARNLVRVDPEMLHTGFGDLSLRVMFEQIAYQRSIDQPAEPEHTGPKLRAVIADYLHAHGYEGTLSEPWAWRMPDGSIRDFETCLVWQMTREGAYGGETGTVAGWRPIEVPVPVAERGRYAARKIVPADAKVLASNPSVAEAQGALRDAQATLARVMKA